MYLRQTPVSDLLYLFDYSCTGMYNVNIEILKIYIYSRAVFLLHDWLQVDYN